MNTQWCKDKTSYLIFDYEAHVHNYWEIIYHLGSDAVETVGDQTFHLTAGTVTLIPGSFPHGKKSKNGFFDICLQVRYLGFPQKPFIVYDSDGSIRILMEMAIKTFLCRDNSYDEITDALVEVIFLEIRKNMQPGFSYEFVNRLKDVIYDNVSNADFDLSEQLHHAGFHPDHVRRRFREMTGMTPLAYLTALRINKAKMLLMDSSFVSIADVAEKCGFHDSFYFSNCFRKSEGISPIRFRMQNKVNISDAEMRE